MNKSIFETYFIFRVFKNTTLIKIGFFISEICLFYNLFLMLPFRYVSLKLVSHETLSIINESIVWFRKNLFTWERGTWKQHNLDLVCPFIQEWKAEYLVFLYELGEKKQKLPKIINIQFPSLKTLRFNFCAIESVEELSRIWMPRL